MESSNDNSQHAGPNVLTTECEDTNQNQWMPPSDAVGDNAKIIVDLGKSTEVYGVTLRNSNGDRGTKNFTIWMSTSENGPWTFYKNWLKDVRNQV